MYRYLRCDYRRLIGLEKHIGQEVLKQMVGVGGFHFLISPGDITIRFAIDKTDLTEDMTTDQNTFHRPVVGLNQCEKTDGQPINTPLKFQRRCHPRNLLLILTLSELS